MREFCFKLFGPSFFDTGLSITPFSVAHIAYMVLIFGGTVALFLWFRHRPAAQKERVLRGLSYYVILSYCADFFVHEFVYDGMNEDKLPFHICTFLGIAMAFAQFHRRGHRFLEPVAVMAIIAPLMYLCYPASVGTGEPWCYQAVQTMLYHGAMMAWGVLTIAFGAVKPRIGRCWQVAALLSGITLWAKLGNLLYGDKNWFFIEEDALYIGLVEGGILPKWTLMVINPAVYFLVALVVYGLCQWAWNKRDKKEVCPVNN